MRCIIVDRKNANSLRRLCEGGLIAALYIALTVPLQPIAFGPLQVRPSEMLTVLPVLTPAAIPGLAVGCVLSNALCIASNPAGAWDILFGSAATLAAALLTRALRRVCLRGWPVMSVLPPILINGVVVGLELTVVYFGGFSWPTFLLCAAEVAAGELIAAGIGGLLLWRLIPKKLFAA